MRDIWLALLVGAALAPTDAALGAGMMVNPAVPARIRRLINVESGLNDGIATPVRAGRDRRRGHRRGTPPAHGPGRRWPNWRSACSIGVAVGGGGGWLVKVARGRGWVAEGFAGAAVLGLAVCCLRHVGGAARQRLHRRVRRRPGVRRRAAGAASQLVPFVEETGALVSLLVWLMFGVVAVVPALESLTWQIVLYAVLSLTRDPDAAGGGRPGRAPGSAGQPSLFVGWFGPRGLASVVFGLLALEDLGEQAARPAVAVIAFTVLLSVVAHGLTAEPLAKRYGPRLAPAAKHDDPAGPSGLPTRRLIRHAPAPGTGRPRRTARLTDRPRLYRKRSTYSRLHVPPELADLHPMPIPASNRFRLA